MIGRPRSDVAAPALVRPDWTSGQSRNPGRLWLDKNENTDPELGAVVREELRRIDPSALYSYPDFLPLYRKLGEHVGVSPRSLLVAAGSDGVIRSCFEAYVDVGDTVVHTAPTFAMYAVYARMYGARALAVEYEPSDQGPVLNLDAMVEVVRRARPKLVCLPNPDSPTGTIVEPDGLHKLIRAAGEADSLILVDEAYYPFLSETLVPWITRYPHLVVARSTGKAWGMAGFRIGYAVATPDVAAILHKVRPMYEASTVAHAVFERMLDRADAMEASVRRLNQGKQEFLGAMEELGLQTLRGHGNFLHVAFGRHAPTVHASLDNIVYYRRDFSEACLKGFSRFSATTAPLFRPVIERIREAIDGKGSS